MSLTIFSLIAILFRLAIHEVKGARNFPLMATICLVLTPLVLYFLLLEFGEFEFNPKNFDCTLLFNDSEVINIGLTLGSFGMCLFILVDTYKCIFRFYKSHPEKLVKNACGKIISPTKIDNFNCFFVRVF